MSQADVAPIPDAPTQTETSASTESKPTRFTSVDALRGFDMFWILGADALAKALPLTTGALAKDVDHETAQQLTGVDKGIHVLAEQLEHVPWDGFHFYDLIFPLFVFLMGVSTAFSLGRIVEQHGKRAAYWRLFRRAIILYLLGILYHGVRGEPPQFRYMGVLHRIAICYLCGGVLFLNLSWRGLLASCVLLLGGYWALMTFVEVPGHGEANWIEGTNLANYIDAEYLKGYKWDGDWDPEGLLSTLPAIVSGILGIFGGLLMKSQRFNGFTRTVTLLVIGGLCLGAGYYWHEQVPTAFFCPIIKKLWTPSFVLYAGGWSFILLAAFHLIIDVIKFDLWARPFVWIGANPITLYMLNNFVGGYGKLVRRVTEEPWIARQIAYYLRSPDLVAAIITTLIPIWIAWLMYRNKFFLRV